MNITSVVALGIVGGALVAGACSKKQEAPQGGSAEPATKAVDPKANADQGKVPAAFAAWMPKGANLAWEQNAWASRMQLRTSGTMSMAGDPVAIEIKGDKAKVFDGKTDHELGFAIDAPCTVAFTKTITEGNMKGGTQTMRKHFVMAEGKFLVGDGAAGYRKGKSAFVCGHGEHEYVTLDESGACKSHRERMGDWEAKDVKCEWTTVDGKEALKIGEGDFPITVIADGDTLQSAQFTDGVKQNLHVAAKSWDDAKAAVTATTKANDPAEIAKAAGGKVGETGTVASLAATFAAERQSTLGKQVEVTALYMNSSSSTANGKTTHSVMLVDSKDQTKLTLPCRVEAVVKDVKQWDKVTAKGTVAESFDKPALENCTVTKSK